MPKHHVRMKIFHGFEALPVFAHPAVTVGSYDGLHIGHRALIETLKAEAVSSGGESILLTFEPHPRITLGKADGLRLLTTLQEKCFLLQRMGLNNLIVIEFDDAFSRLSPFDFVQKYLIEKVGAETMIVGFDHRFGRNNEGNHAFLNTQYFPLRVVEISECDIDSQKVSSTVVRKLIGQGKMQQAAKLLGHPYLVIGDNTNGVVRIGRLKMLPPQGEYNVHVNGQPATAQIDEAGRLHIHPDIPCGEVRINF